MLHENEELEAELQRVQAANAQAAGILAAPTQSLAQPLPGDHLPQGVPTVIGFAPGSPQPAAPPPQPRLDPPKRPRPDDDD